MKFFSRWLAVVAFVTGGALAALPAGTATAATSGTGVTIHVGSMKVHAQVMVTLTVHVVCADAGAGTFEYDAVSVSLLQANGNSVSSASAASDAGGPYGGTPFLTCDGSTVNVFKFSLLPAAGTSPFSAGPAVLTVSVTHDLTSGSDSGTLGPQVVELVAAPLPG